MTMASVAATMVTGTGRILETGPVPTTTAHHSGAPGAQSKL